MTDAREALVALLWQADHAPLSAHDPRDGSCQSCPWPLHEMPPEDIADAILAEFDVTPRGERVKPSVEAVNFTEVANLAQEMLGKGVWPDTARAVFEAVLALYPGRTEAEVKAEALRGAAREVAAEEFLRALPPAEYGETAVETAADWLNDLADTIEKGADRG